MKKKKLLFILSCNICMYGIGIDSENDESQPEYNLSQKEKDRQILDEQRQDFERRNSKFVSRDASKSPLSSRSSKDSVGYDLESDDKAMFVWKQKAIAEYERKFPDIVEWRVDKQMLESFEDGLSNFATSAQAIDGVEKFLQNSNPPDRAANIQNKEGETLLSILLFNLSYTPIDLSLKIVQLLLNHGAKVSTADMEQAIGFYRNYLFIHNLDHPSGTLLNRILNRFLENDEQKKQIKEYRDVASQLAEIVFMLDKKIENSKVTLQQKLIIHAMKEKHLSLWKQISFVSF